MSEKGGAAFKNSGPLVREASANSDRVAALYDKGLATKADILRAERKLYRAIEREGGR